MTSRRAQRVELISPSEQMLIRREPDDDQVERLLEFQAAHVPAHDSDTSVAHPVLAERQHCLRRVHGGHMATVFGKRNGETSATSTELEHTLSWRREFSEHLDIVGEWSEVQVIPGRNRT